MENNFTGRTTLFIIGILAGIFFGFLGNMTDSGLQVILYIVAGIFLAGIVIVPLIMILNDKKYNN